VNRSGDRKEARANKGFRAIQEEEEEEEEEQRNITFLCEAFEMAFDTLNMNTGFDVPHEKMRGNLVNTLKTKAFRISHSVLLILHFASSYGTGE
jgi:hypothetical protein